MLATQMLHKEAFVGAAMKYGGKAINYMTRNFKNAHGAQNAINTAGSKMSTAGLKATEHARNIALAKGVGKVGIGTAATYGGYKALGG